MSGVIIFNDVADNLGESHIGRLEGCEPFEAIREHPTQNVLLAYSHKGESVARGVLRVFNWALLMGFLRSCSGGVLPWVTS